MFVKDILLLKNVYISPYQSREEAIKLMSSYHSWDIPVVNGKQLMGNLSEGDLLAADKDSLIESLCEDLPGFHLKTSDHLLFAYQFMLKSGVFLMPVINENMEFAGTMSRLVLFDNFGKVFGFFDPGSLIVLRVKRTDFALSEISRIIEGENSTVISSLVSADEDPTFLNITVKLQTFEIRDIVTSLKRHDYNVLSFYNEDNLQGFLEDRYDQLINYLNI